jgi:hypothetical protein
MGQRLGNEFTARPKRKVSTYDTTTRKKPIVARVTTGALNFWYVGGISASSAPLYNGAPMVNI